MVVLGQERADLLEEVRFLDGGDRVLRPGLGGQYLGCGLVLFGGKRGRQRGHADTGGGRGLGEERLDVARAGTAVQQRLLGALVEALAVGPGRIGQHERADLGGSAVAASIQVPVDQLASRGVRDLVAQRLALGQVGLGYGLHRIANAAHVFCADRAIACCGDGGVVARGVLHLLGRRSRRGACLGGWCRSGLRSWLCRGRCRCLLLGFSRLGLGRGLGRTDLGRRLLLRGLSVARTPRRGVRRREPG